MFRTVEVAVNSSGWTSVQSPLNFDNVILRNTGQTQLKYTHEDPNSGVAFDTLEPWDIFRLETQFPKYEKRYRFMQGEVALFLRTVSGTSTIRVTFSN